ncbi:MAG: 3D-(3,5/4)-trihydroxycyclohexane-1,2-dione acylhydrolase (decyclizing) [Planctomycetota bacterium]|jgi:3D-(3,5/4)-trihydroxycyclohexane-1,2-dione acylhydrolase (decyclizing)|nr:3D-(3,5/4)-trihydroxycyclohexane-1,2-dione acylhydrolase (decyclizing) [Planctomycetota bacterium]
MKTMRMTTGQALVKFLDRQYVSFDGVESKFVAGVFTVFGHGCVVGIGQALDENPGKLKVFMGKNEQGMAHAATGFAKQNNRRGIIACASSIGPGAANMVAAAGVASVNNIPLLLLPGDAFASRQPDPVLQQLEHADDPTRTTNDAFKAVCRYWDRVSRPEMLMTALINAMRVLTDPALAGAVCVAMPQDVQGEAWDFPVDFFARRVHRITRPVPVDEEIADAARAIKAAKKPFVVVGGGVRYSEAGKAVVAFCEKYNLPVGETQAGKGSISSSHPLNLGGLGGTGNAAANRVAAKSDLIIGAGTRFTDFTTASKSLFSNARVVALNVSAFHAEKLDAIRVVGDAKAGIEKLTAALAGYKSRYNKEIATAKAGWARELKRLSSILYSGRGFVPEVGERDPRSVDEFAEITGGRIAQTAGLAMVRKIIPGDAIVVGASGSLPGDMQRMWETEVRDSYHMEYGYSCMGYEIAAALGAKLARPDREVYAMVGDGSYLMLHSEMVTAVQEGVKINVLVFDNSGFGCINNLQMGQGIGSLATEFRGRNRRTGKLDGPLMLIDYAKNAESYGFKTYTALTLPELEAALGDSLKQTRPVLIDIKTLPKTMTHGYDSWWHVGNAAVTRSEKGRKAYAEKIGMLKKIRRY